MDGPFKHKEGFGTLWYQDQEQGSNRPIAKGKATTPDGVEVEIAIWKGKTKKGDDVLQVRIDPPYQGGSQDESPI
jgi:hypothetical protein